MPNLQLRLKAFASDGIVHITGIQPGQPLRIYNLTGQLVYSDIAKSSEEQIPLTMRGVYVVVAGDQTMKISVF